MAARALFAFAGRSLAAADPEAVAGAMLISEAFDNLRVLTRIARAWYEANRKKPRRGRRR